MKIDCITIFPEMFAPMKSSIMGRAQAKGLFEFNTVYLRDFAINAYGQVDDVPYGGEPGMVLRPEPLAKAIRSTGVKEDGGKVIYLTADGVPFTHKIAKELSQENHLVLVCGHYKGIDYRIREHLITKEVSIGDYVLTGGELAAAVMADAIVRILPGALGDEQSALSDSFQDSLLAAPVYTRPAEYKGWKVPDILLSGHEAKIKEWELAQSMERTRKLRPDLLNKSELRGNIVTPNS